jgi:prenylcysteine oxidase/farnesylcysteine lyase
LQANTSVGAGAGGSSAAYYLRQFADQSGVDIDITVYERASYIGGRSTTVNAYNDARFPVELGGSIFVATNEILKNFTLEHGLEPQDSGTEYSDILGIWNGESFVHIMKDSGWQWWDNTKLLWKYRMAPIKTVRLMKVVVGKFKQLYTAPFFPFRSLSNRAEDLGLLPATGVTGEQYLEKNGVSRFTPKPLLLSHIYR